MIPWQKMARKHVFVILRSHYRPSPSLYLSQSKRFGGVAWDHTNQFVQYRRRMVMTQVPAAPRPSSSFTLKPKSLQFPVSSAMRNLAAVRPLFTVGFTQPIYEWRIKVIESRILAKLLHCTAKPRATTTRPQICESKRPTAIEGWEGAREHSNDSCKNPLATIFTLRYDAP